MGLFKPLSPHYKCAVLMQESGGYLQGVELRENLILGIDFSGSILLDLHLGKTFLVNFLTKVIFQYSSREIFCLSLI